MRVNLLTITSLTVSFLAVACLSSERQPGSQRIPGVASDSEGVFRIALPDLTSLAQTVGQQNAITHYQIRVEPDVSGGADCLPYRRDQVSPYFGPNVEDLRLKKSCSFFVYLSMGRQQLGQVPGQQLSQVPGQIPGQQPGQTPGQQQPGQTPGQQQPGQTPGQQNAITSFYSLSNPIQINQFSWQSGQSTLSLDMVLNRTPEGTTARYPQTSLFISGNQSAGSGGNPPPNGTQPGTTPPGTNNGQDAGLIAFGTAVAPRVISCATAACHGSTTPIAGQNLGVNNQTNRNTLLNFIRRNGTCQANTLFAKISGGSHGGGNQGAALPLVQIQQWLGPEPGCS